MIRKIKSTIRGKMIALTLGLSIVPLVLIMLATSVFFFNDALDRQINSSMSLLDRTAEALSVRMSGIEMATMMAIIDKNVRALMASDRDGSDFRLHSPDGKMVYDKNSAALNFFTTLEIQNNDVYGITLITNREVYYKFRGVQMYDDNFQRVYHEYDWFKQSIAQKGRPVYIGTHTPYDSVGAQTDVVSVARSIFDANSGKYLGTILVDADAGILDSVCGGISMPSMGALLVMDADGEIIYKTGGALELSADDRARVAASSRRGNFSIVAGDGVQYLLSYAKSTETGWYVMHTLPYQTLINQSMSPSLFIVAGMLIVLLLIVIGNMLLMRTVSNPIIQLSQNLEQVGRGDLRYGDEPALDRTDEIGGLAKGMRDMKMNLNELIFRLSKALESEKEAELLALQNQINPHFIHNTLSSIQMMAKLNDDEPTAVMLEKLGRLFHTQISSGRALIPLGEELELVDNYIALQSMRYEEKLTYRQSVDGAYLECMCPKFSIQPLVENAISHGIEGKPEGGVIAVSAREEGGDLIICVEDNGLGISEENLMAIRRKLVDEPEGSGKRIGIKNVHDRLRLYFGEQYGISVTSVGVTRIEMRLPIVREADMGKYRIGGK